MAIFLTISFADSFGSEAIIVGRMSRMKRKYGVRGFLGRGGMPKRSSRVLDLKPHVPTTIWLDLWEASFGKHNLNWRYSEKKLLCRIKQRFYS